MTVNFNRSDILVFNKKDGTEIEITKFDPIPNEEAKKARAKVILHFYGGCLNYKLISPTTIFSEDETYCPADSPQLSLPLQVFPVGSPLYLVKQELGKDEDSINGVIFFFRWRCINGRANKTNQKRSRKSCKIGG